MQIKRDWIFPAAIERGKLEKLVQTLDILPVTAMILAQRGWEGEGARSFLDPTGLRLRQFRDLPGTWEAGLRIAAAIRHQEPIVVFGDYDVDGITASALIVEFIRHRGGQCEAYIPNRLLEGYGLNQEAVARALASGTKLLITVDCGITAFEEIAFARQGGMEVIVTDHHEPAAEIPLGVIVVNPKVTGPADLAILAGVGVILQVVRATAEALGETDPEQLRKCLDLVALGTVADVVPLLGENRSLTRAGLAVLNRGGRLGLRALAKAAGVDDKPLTSRDLAYRLAPRINAAGRLGDSHAAFDLLLTRDAETAEKLAHFLHQQNSRRQTLEQTIMDKAEAQINTWSSLPEVIVLSGQDWPLGVVGLTASRLCEKYFRPCFVLSEQNGIVKGSGRSIAGFSLCRALSAMTGLMQKWGGHDMAAGVMLQAGHLQDFKAALQEQAQATIPETDRKPSFKIEADITLADMTPELIQNLRRFEPHGYKNARPLLAFLKLTVCLPPRVVGDKHLKLKVTDGCNRFLDVIGFGLGARALDVKMNNLIDIVGHASENVWNNAKILQIEMKDFRPSV